MILFPYEADVPMSRRPFANYVTIGISVIVGMIVAGSGYEDWMVLGFGSPAAWVGHMFSHGGFMHLLGNMVFLWVFGNAVCSKVGNAFYPLVYLGLGLVAALSHVIFDGGPMLGASGAINGIVGLFLVLYPINTVTCLYCVWIMFFMRFGTWTVKSVWIILLWLLFDIVGIVLGGENVAYMAHVGGFAGGVFLGVALLFTGLVKPSRGEVSLLDVLGIRLGEDAVPGPRRPLAVVRRSSPVVMRQEKATILQERIMSELNPIGVDEPETTPLASPATVWALCECGQPIKAPVKYAGKRIRCPSCREPVRLPEA